MVCINCVNCICLPHIVWLSTIVNLMVNLCFAVQLILYVLNGVEILANRVQWHVVDIVLLQEFSGDPGYMRAGIVLFVLLNNATIGESFIFTI